MSVDDLKKYLLSRGATYGSDYTIGGLGDGIYGIEKIGRFWYSYEAKKDFYFRKMNYTRMGSQTEAFDFIILKAKEFASRSNSWRDHG